MLPLEGGGVTVRIPAEAGPRQVQLMSAVNRRVKEPTDLEKENKKQRQRRGLGRARPGLCITRLGLQPLLPRAVLLFFLSLGLYRAHASGRSPRYMAQYRMRSAKRTGHSGQRLQARGPSPTCLGVAG